MTKIEQCRPIIKRLSTQLWVAWSLKYLYHLLRYNILNVVGVYIIFSKVGVNNIFGFENIK